MGHSSGIISAPVNTDDVRLTIGENSDDVSTLCLSSKINKAALFCPRYVGRPDIQLKVNGAFSASALNYIRQLNNVRTNYTIGPYGVCIPNLQLGNFAQGNSSSYDRVFNCARSTWYIARPNAPTGTLPVVSTSFKTLDHFDGYDHYAQITNPVATASVSVTPNGDKEIAAVFSVPSADGTTLSISNLFGGGGWYFGVIVFRGTNSDGWHPSDVVHAASSGTAIGTSTAGYTVTVYDDAYSDDDYYRIIPFITNKRGVSSTDDISGAFIDSTCYGVRIDDSCGSVFTVRPGGSTSGGGHIQNYIFNWKEGNNGYYYPVPGNNSFTYTGGSDGPGIAIYFSESTWYKQIGYTTLKAALKRVDMILPYINENGINVESVFTWSPSGSTYGNDTLYRESKYDGHADKLFFYLKPAQSTPILNLGLTDILGRFYWKDGTTEDLFATYIPDLAG